jgi:hypothetical protein
MTDCSRLAQQSDKPACVSSAIIIRSFGEPNALQDADVKFEQIPSFVLLVIYPLILYGLNLEVQI